MNKKKVSSLKPEFSKISPGLLVCMPYEYPGRDIEVKTCTDEFTCLCPWSGLPDFAGLAITYIPDKKVVELKSLKYYIHSYRQAGIVHESAVNRIIADLVSAVRPKYMCVEMDFNVRGGLKTTVKAEYRK